MTVTPFTIEDWYGYAGAERWETENVSETENEPVIAGIENDNFFMLAAKNGICLEIVDEHSFDSVCYDNNTVFNSQADAISALSAISDDATAEQIILLMGMKITGTE